MTEDSFKRLEDKIDGLSDRLNNIDRTLAAQHVSLKQHMRRSDALEAQIKPIQEHVSALKGFLKGLTWIISIGAAAGSIITAFWMIGGGKK